MCGQAHRDSSVCCVSSRLDAGEVVPSSEPLEHNARSLPIGPFEGPLSGDLDDADFRLGQDDPRALLEEL